VKAFDDLGATSTAAGKSTIAARKTFNRGRPWSKIKKRHIRWINIQQVEIKYFAAEARGEFHAFHHRARLPTEVGVPAQARHRGSRAFVGTWPRSVFAFGKIKRTGTTDGAYTPLLLRDSKLPMHRDLKTHASFNILPGKVIYMDSRRRAKASTTQRASRGGQSRARQTADTLNPTPVADGQTPAGNDPPSQCVGVGKTNPGKKAVDRPRRRIECSRTHPYESMAIAFGNRRADRRAHNRT